MIGGDGPALDGRRGGVGVAFMVGTSWYQRKADECALSAENSDDPRNRSRMEAESRLWRQIALSEARQDEMRPKAKWVAHYE
jgi:hypothetical protein